VLCALSPQKAKKMKLSVHMIALGFRNVCSDLSLAPSGVDVDALCMQAHFMKLAGAAMRLESWPNLCVFSKNI
jgi:hypothetical protein